MTRWLAALLLGTSLAIGARAQSAASQAAVSHSVDLVFAGLLSHDYRWHVDAVPGAPLTHPVVSTLYTGPRPARRTDDIEAAYGLMFGVLFVPGDDTLRDGPQLEFVTRNAARSYTSRFVCIAGQVCDAEIVLVDPADFVPGDWVLQIRGLDGTMLLEHHFKLSVPPGAVAAAASAASAMSRVAAEHERAEAIGMERMLRSMGLPAASGAARASPGH